MPHYYIPDLSSNEHPNGAVVCFGSKLVDDEEDEYALNRSLPWNDRFFHGDFQLWWIYKRGFKPSFDPYREDKEDLRDDVTTQQMNKYFYERRVYLNQNPCPIQYINYYIGNSGHTRHVIGVRNTVVKSTAIDPAIIPRDLFQKTTTSKKIFDDFYEEYLKDLNLKLNPDWLLLSYWDYDQYFREIMEKRKGE